MSARYSMHYVLLKFKLYSEEKGIPQKTQAEIDEDVQVQWHSSQEALELVSQPNINDYGWQFIQKRDIALMHVALKHISENAPGTV